MFMLYPSTDIFLCPIYTFQTQFKLVLLLLWHSQEHAPTKLLFLLPFKISQALNMILLISVKRRTNCNEFIFSIKQACQIVTHIWQPILD